MNDNLPATLNKMMQSGSWSNPAMNALIIDYIKYHIVLVVAGSILVVIFALLSIVFWARWKRASKTDQRKWTFEKKTYFSFTVVCAVVGLLVAFIAVVNATTVADPRQGFALLVDSLGTPKAGTPMAKLDQAFNTWIQSGSTSIPPLVQRKIAERVAFHTTKSLVSGIFLVVFVALTTLIWRTLIKRSRLPQVKWRLQDSALLVCGVAGVICSLLLLVIVVANMQGALAPIAMTLFYG